MPVRIVAAFFGLKKVLQLLLIGLIVDAITLGLISYAIMHNAQRRCAQEIAYRSGLDYKNRKINTNTYIHIYLIFRL